MDMRNIDNNIPLRVQEWAVEHVTSGKAFVSLLVYRDGEVIERTFGVKKYKSGELKITEVRRRSTDADYILWKNLTYSLGGYHPVFEAKDKISSSGWGYRVFKKEWFDRWDIAGKPLNLDCKCLNPNIVTEVEEFKYCGYKGGDVIKYLKAYRDNPLIEFFGKCGLPISASLISSASKDKRFRSFLAKNADKVMAYGPQATKCAFKHNITIPEAYRKLNERRKGLQRIPELRGTKLDVEKIVDWCDFNKVGYPIYNDYLKAIKELGLDLKDTKNIYPRQFKRMHDIRTSEYDSLMARRDREKRKALYKAFSEAGQAAKKYEWTEQKHKIIAPLDISELKQEGRALKHCVGQMGYDKKMADGKIIIMFVRQVDEPRKPYVTIEYDLERKQLRQAYGKNNSRPNAETLKFINSWCKRMKEDKNGSIDNA